MTETWAARVESNTLATAEHHREPWTRDEIEFVVTFTDVERDEDIAYALGRSLYAVWAIQHRIRSGELATPPATKRTKTTTQWDQGYDYVTTFPPGYFD